MIHALASYLHGAVAEMRKVVWPTKKQTIQYSGVVIGLSAGLAIFFGVLDFILSSALNSVIK